MYFGIFTLFLHRLGVLKTPSLRLTKFLNNLRQFFEWCLLTAFQLTGHLAYSSRSLSLWSLNFEMNMSEVHYALLKCKLVLQTWVGSKPTLVRARMNKFTRSAGGISLIEEMCFHVFVNHDL